MNCVHCGIETINPKFCTRSCAVKHNNKIPKRKRRAKLCKTCGESNPEKFKQDSIICYTCKVQAFKYNRQTRKAIKQLCVDYKGGKCIKCNYNKSLDALHFHHRDKTTKSFSIASYLNAKRKISLNEYLTTELDKCDLLCANCHYETHEAEKEGIEPSLTFSKT